MTERPLSSKRSAMAALTVVLVLGALLASASLAHAASYTYTGGPTTNAQGLADWPSLVANDHSVYAVRFRGQRPARRDRPAGAHRDDVLRQRSGSVSARRLGEARTAASPGTRPARSGLRSARRGRASPRSRPAARAPTCPDLTPAGSPSSSATRPSPAPTSSSSHCRPAVPATPRTTRGHQPITVLDPSGTLSGATAGFAVHNGAAQVATGKRMRGPRRWYVGARSDETSRTASTMTPTAWSTTRTTARAAPAATSTSACPSRGPSTSTSRRYIWPVGASSFTGTLADVDIALGASDQAPPTAPTGLASSATSGKAVRA